VLVEKILRVEPGVKKLYLLVRAPDDAAAHQRVVHEVNGLFFLTFPPHLPPEERNRSSQKPGPNRVTLKIPARHFKKICK
jgi:hypothetical protein